jgi:DNA-binding transcriptional ArsR family regulator
MSSTLISQKKLDRASEILRALSHPLRLKLISFIDSQKEINVNKIYGTLKMEQSITSQNLKILRNTDIVKTARKGKYIIYSLNYETIEKYAAAVNVLLKKS